MKRYVAAAALAASLWSELNAPAGATPRESAEFPVEVVWTPGLQVYCFVTYGGVTYNFGAATIVGTSGDDVLVGTPGPDVIAGLGGNDEIYGGGGADVICGGAGDDYVDGGGTFDWLIGDGGNDILVGGEGNDLLWGEEGDDQLYGDRLEGERFLDVWDILDGGPGTDRCDGGGSSGVADFYSFCEIVAE